MSMVSKYRSALMAIPKKLLNMLIFIGGITLEVYLLHEEIIMNSMRLYMHPRYFIVSEVIQKVEKTFF